LSDRGLICVYSKAIIDASMERLIFLVEDNDSRAKWDPNYDNGELIKDMQE